MKLFNVFATETDGHGYKRGIDFLVQAKTLASANKKAFRVLKNEWDCADETEIEENFTGNKCIVFPNDCFIELSTIQVEETTAEEFVKKFIRVA